jgi:hypothetical protein
MQTKIPSFKNLVFFTCAEILKRTGKTLTGNK